MASRKRLKPGEWLLFFAPIFLLGLIFVTGWYFSPEQQAKRIINWVRYAPIVSASESAQIGRLAGLGPPAHDLVIAELEAMKRNPEKYRKGVGYVVLFRAAIKAKDMRAMPYFEHFERDDNESVRYFAVQSRMHLLASHLPNQRRSPIVGYR